MYLTILDFENHQRKTDLDILTNGGNASVLTFGIASATEEVKSYLAMRFDNEAIFIDLYLHNNTNNYVEGNQVLVDDAGTLKYFVAIQDNINQNPLTATTYWKEDDARNTHLVMICVDVATYHMYAKIPTRQTPQDVVDRYIDAKEWLTGVAKGMFKPSLPLLTDTTTPTAPSFFGSSEKIDNEW